jgi:hypothetical protein
MQKETILNILHSLPSGAVNKANLKAQIAASPEYPQHSPRSCQTTNQATKQPNATEPIKRQARSQLALRVQDAEDRHQ